MDTEMPPEPSSNIAVPFSHWFCNCCLHTTLWRTIFLILVSFSNEGFSPVCCNEWFVRVLFPLPPRNIFFLFSPATDTHQPVHSRKQTKTHLPAGRIFGLKTILFDKRKKTIILKSKYCNASMSPSNWTKWTGTSAHAPTEPSCGRRGSVVLNKINYLTHPWAPFRWDALVPLVTNKSVVRLLNNCTNV